MDSKETTAQAASNEISEPQSTWMSRSTGRTPRSCNGCHTRKVRCDKKDPCQTCERAGRPCNYPQLGPRKRRTKRSIIADMASRISTLERSLSEVKESEQAEQSLISPKGSITPARPPVVALPSENLGDDSGAEILVHAGSSSHYFNEILLSRVMKEAQGLNMELQSSSAQTAAIRSPIHCAFTPMGIFTSPSLSMGPASFHPHKQVALRLWNAYIANVEMGTGCNLLHTPTDQLKVCSTIDNPTKAPLENLALCFAIYFAATVSLHVKDICTVVGQDACTLLLQFKVGLEQAFAHADFLDSPTVTGLHALSIYLSALRVRNQGKSMWILNGLAIRMAQSLGLHRSGERHGISPFQSEIRCRLWWNLLGRDCRAGEDYGLESSLSRSLVSEVRSPLNADDSEFYLEMQSLPKEKLGWTHMTFSIMYIDLLTTTQRLAILAAKSSATTPIGDNTRTQIVNETRIRIEKLQAYCDPVIPAQRLSLFSSRFMLRKLDFLTRLQWISLSSSGPQAELVTEQNLIEALELLETGIFPEDSMLEQFLWVKMAYPQTQITLYILWHLCVKPRGPSIERAWEAIDKLFSDGPWNEFNQGFGSKAAVIDRLRATALLMRRDGRRPGTDRYESTGYCGSSFASSLGGDSFESQSLSAYLFGDNNANAEFGLESAMDEWPAWTTLIPGFQL